MGICKFCGKEKELIDSHIIPQCFYQLSKNNPIVKVAEQGIDKNKHYQNGGKEPLMCKACDNELGKLDGYANKVLNKAVPKLNLITNDEGIQYYSLTSENFKIANLRKFFISILWRLSICSKGIPLGKYQDIALGILKEEISDDPTLFLPLIYRLNTEKNIHQITLCGETKYLKKTSYILRWPDYQILIIVNTKDSENSQLMNINKTQFNEKEVKIVSMTGPVSLDYVLQNQFPWIKN